MGLVTVSLKNVGIFLFRKNLIEETRVSTTCHTSSGLNLAVSSDLNGKASRGMGINYTQIQNLRYNLDVGLARGSELQFKSPY